MWFSWGDTDTYLFTTQRTLMTEQKKIIPKSSLVTQYVYWSYISINDSKAAAISMYSPFQYEPAPKIWIPGASCPTESYPLIKNLFFTAVAIACFYNLSEEPCESCFRSFLRLVCFVCFLSHVSLINSWVLISLLLWKQCFGAEERVIQQMQGDIRWDM